MVTKARERGARRLCKNAAGRSLVLHDFAKLLAKGKGEDKEKANRQLGQVVKRGPRKKKEELEVQTVEVEEMEVEAEVGL